MKEFWNERYSQEEFAYGTSPNVWLKECLNTLPPGRLLVPGAGEGRDAVYAAQQGWQVTAFDQSEAGKAKALKLAAAAGVQVQYEVCDVQQFESTIKFDAIALIFFHLPPILRKPFHSSLAGMLEPGGLVILESFSPKQLDMTSGGPKELSMLVTPEILAEEFSYLQILTNTAMQTHLSEGPYHQGLAEVVRFYGKMPL